MATFIDINPEYGISPLGELVEDIGAINSSISNIIRTNPGERFFLPQFGSQIGSMLFEPINDDTADEIMNLVINAINRWDSRVLVDYQRSSVTPIHDENRYDVTITYTIAGLGDEGVFNESLDAS